MLRETLPGMWAAAAWAAAAAAATNTCRVLVCTILAMLVMQAFLAFQVLTVVASLPEWDC